jgi:four helix bundle protein
VFTTADALAERIYKATRGFPADERYGLRSQIRRAAVSVPTNIVEGSARVTTREYLNFLNNALGSACETRYLVDLCARLEFLDATNRAELEAGYAGLCPALQSLINQLRAMDRQSSRRPQSVVSSHKSAAGSP